MESSSSCFEAAIRRLACKGYLSYELQEKLLTLGFSSDEVDQTLFRLQEMGYLDDQAWVDSFIEAQKRKRVGALLIIQKLKLKRVPSELYLPKIKELNENPQEAIQSLLVSRYKNKNLKDPKEKKQVISSLLRRGFSFNDIKIVINI